MRIDRGLELERAGTASPPPFDIEAAVVTLIQRDAVKVPPYPAVALKLGQLVQRPDYGIPEVVKIIAADQMLAADVLRCANSAFYTRGDSITSLPQAVARVGAKEVVRLALAAGLAGNARVPGGLQSLKRQAWQSSIASAVICQVLAEGRRLPAADAFVCGLVHDFGRVVGLSCIEGLLDQHHEVAPKPTAYWSGMLDRLHVELGLVIATRWKLPDLFRSVIGCHHSGDFETNTFAPMIELVVASDAVVALLSERPHVSATELAALLPSLSAAEREALVRALPEIPAVIASFEGEPQPQTHPNKVLAPETTLPEGFRPLEREVHQVSPKKRGPYAMQGIASLGWLMRGTEPLPENQLIEATIASQPEPMKMWAKATLCVPAPEGGFRLECKPFALNGPALVRWNDLYRLAPRS